MTKFLSISEITRRRSWTLVRTNFFVFFHFLRLASPAVRVTEGLWIYPSSLQAKTGRLQGVNPLPTDIKATSKDKKICRRVHPSCTSLKFILLFESRHWYLIFDANPHKSKVSIPKRFPFYGNEQHCCNCSVTGILRTGMTLYCGVIHLNLRASSELEIFFFSIHFSNVPSKRYKQSKRSRSWHIRWSTISIFSPECVWSWRFAQSHSCPFQHISLLAESPRGFGLQLVRQAKLERLPPDVCSMCLDAKRVNYTGSDTSGGPSASVCIWIYFLLAPRRLLRTATPQRFTPRRPMSVRLRGRLHNAAPRWHFLHPPSL